VARAGAKAFNRKDREEFAKDAKKIFNTGDEPLISQRDADLGWPSGRWQKAGGFFMETIPTSRAQNAREMGHPVLIE
jgi:hypothetical protein